MASPKASKVSPLSASWMFVVAFSAASLIARTSPVNNDDPCATFRSSNGGGTDGTSAFALICTCNTTIADGRSFHQVNCIDTDLTSVPVGLPSNIDNFRLEGNHFHILEHISYTALHNLFLDNNDIRFIKDLAFSNLSHLIQLHLGSNKISGLSAKTFVGLRGLKTLFMRNNRLYELESETFSGGALPKLELLILASCRIVRIAPDAFQGATSLTMLDLSDNMLTSPVQFLGHLKIDTLNLSANHVENLSNSPFQYLTRLETLSLSHNQIFNLSVTAFRGLAQLTLLDLNNNSISSIDSGTLEVSDRLIELDLSSNSLRSAPEGAFPWGSLSKLRVHGNPWTCDCRTKWLHNQPVVIEWNLNSNLRCAAPSSVADRLVFRTNDHVFDCPHSHNVTVGAIIGILVAVTLAIFGSFLLYKLVVKKKRLTSSNARARSNGVSVSATSSYSRVQDSRELFDSCVESNVT